MKIDKKYYLPSGLIDFRNFYFVDKSYSRGFSVGHGEIRRL